MPIIYIEHSISLFFTDILYKPGKYIVIVFAGFLLFSCGNKKKQTVIQPEDTVVASPAATDITLDTLQLPEEPEVPEPEIIVNEYFDDFLFHFASDSSFQQKRIVFPLPYYKENEPLRIEKQEWQHDSLFFDHSYYTLLFDTEEEMDLSEDPDLNSIQIEWIYMQQQKIKKYYFERINGRWVLEAINLHAFEEKEQDNFVSFFIEFTTDSIYQSNHIAHPLVFITTDPDDDFSVLETTLDFNQWFAFKPELPLKEFSNINYGQKNDDNSSLKIVHLKGVGNGFSNTLFFRRKHSKWELYKFEDISN